MMHAPALFADEFEQFRQAYPPKGRMGGPKAHDAFWKARQLAFFDELMSALEQHKRSEQWQTPQFIPGLTVWLNQQRWRQVLPEPKPKVGSPDYYTGLDYHCEHQPTCGTRVQHRQRLALEQAKRSA